MAKPDHIKPDLLAALPAYKMCSDCYQGERAVKGRESYTNASVNNGGGGSSHLALSPYLPDPSPATESDAVRKKRYHDYVTRAVFYNVTKRTTKAMTGEVFSKYPLLTLGQLDFLESDVDGSGQSLTQQAKDALTNALLKGRGGLFVDMPVNIDGMSKADVVSQNIRPIIAHYSSESIINWRYRKVGGVYKLSLVVLSEPYLIEDDGFEAKTGRQLLVLRLNDNNRVESEIYRKSDDSDWLSQGINVITDHKAQQLTEIPFYAYGSVNNDLELDDIPMFDIAHLNIAHFRNSADYEEANFISGQPTLILAGLTNEWVTDVLKGGIAIGSRTSVLLPVGGNAQMLQAESNSAIMEAMKHKEDMMASLGAKLIEIGANSNMTATQANNEQAEQTSVLSTIANNLSDAYTKAIKMCARFMGYDDVDLVVTFNTNFGFAKLTVEQRQMLLQEYQAGSISWVEYRAQLVESEIATNEDARDAKREIEQEQGALINQDRAE